LLRGFEDSLHRTGARLTPPNPTLTHSQELGDVLDTITNPTQQQQQKQQPRGSSPKKGGMMRQWTAVDALMEATEEEEEEGDPEDPLPTGNLAGGYLDDGRTGPPGADGGPGGGLGGQFGSLGSLGDKGAGEWNTYLTRI